MIVQTASTPGTSGSSAATHVVIDQLEHTRMAGRFAAAFGNGEFAAPSPRPLMEYLVTHHDEGWDEIDQEMPQDPDTGLPYNLVRTPLPLLLRTGPRSPDFNERHHPYCGLLVSMHTFGLYNGRYGLSDKIFVNMIPLEHQATVHAMLAAELDRQTRLRRVLTERSDCVEWVEEEHLFRNYKLLQLFDTLALYFNMTHEAGRSTAKFDNVPQGPGKKDVTLTIERLAPGRYRMSPFPFGAAPLVVSCVGKRLAPQPAGTDVAALLRTLPAEVETMTIEA